MNSYPLYLQLRFGMIKVLECYKLDLQLVYIGLDAKVNCRRIAAWIFCIADILLLLQVAIVLSVRIVIWKLMKLVGSLLMQVYCLCW